MSLLGIGVVVAITSVWQGHIAQASSTAHRHIILIDEDDTDAMYYISNKYKVKSAFDPPNRYISYAPLN